MKKFYSYYLAALAWLLLISSASRAQEIDTTFAARMKYIFQYLDKSKIPHGLLQDVALDFADLSNYTGLNLADTNRVDYKVWNEIYTTLFTARVAILPSGVLPDKNLIDSIWFSKRKSGQVTLAGLYYQYSRFADDAANKVSVINDQIFDQYVNGVWQNPYKTEQVMAFSPASAEYKGLNFTLVFPSALWFSNQKQSVTKIEVNMDDGLGYRQLNLNAGLPVLYADSGLKVIQFKIWLNNNTQLQSHSLLHISKSAYESTPLNTYSFTGPQPDLGAEFAFMPPEADFVPQPFNALPVGWQIKSQFYKKDEFLVKSDENYGGKYAEGQVTIQYASDDKKIRKPLIIAEGFDPGIYMLPEDITGTYDFDSFKTSLGYASDLVAYLNNNLYDIIFIDWKDGTADMHLNALLLKKVIKDINSMKIADNNGNKEKNVVLGQSMGGVIARYVLRKMELAGEDHDTRLYISHDAPHQGANVPLGFQYLAKNLRKIYFKGYLGNIVKFFDDQALNKISMANTDAARQLLINYANNDYQIDNSMHIQWQNELKNLGYPQLSRNIAISNGSECGDPYDLPAGANLLLLDGKMKLNNSFTFPEKYWLYPILAIVTGHGGLLWGLLPGNKDRFVYHFEANALANGGGNKAYMGKITFKKKILGFINLSTSLVDKTIYAPAAMLSYDNLPGSYISVVSDPASMAQKAQAYGATLSIAKGFSFVNTVSSLDVGKGQVVLDNFDYFIKYVGATPPAAPKNIPFHNFIVDYNTSVKNQEHISFDERNGDWLVKELQLADLQNMPKADCNFYCSPAANAIIGQATICGTNNYTVSNLPFGANVLWSVTGPIQILGANNLASVNIKQTGNGSGVIIAVISSLCGKITFSKTITASGAPDMQEIVGQYYDYAPLQVAPSNLIPSEDYNPSQGITFSVPYVAGLTYNWKVNSTIYPINDENTLTIFAPQCGYGYPTYEFYEVELKMSNICGTTTVCKTFGFYCNPIPHLEQLGACGIFDVTFSNLFTVYPNPASEDITITYTEERLQEFERLNQPIPEFEINFYNEKGLLMLNAKSREGQRELHFDTRNLPNGNYFLHIQQGRQVVKEQIIIQH